MNVPIKVAKNLGMMIVDQESFSDHIASVSESCRFALCNIREIRPYLTQHATRLLLQALAGVGKRF